MEEHASIELVHSRIRLMCLIFVAMMLVVSARYWQLQVIDGQMYDDLANENRIEQVRLVASRGLILDRHGSVLAENRPSYSLWVNRSIPWQQRKAVMLHLGEVLGIDPESVLQAYLRKPRVEQDYHVRLLADITPQQLATFETHKYELHGIRLQRGERRHYPRGDFLSHVLGYVGEINEQELSREVFKKLQVQRGDYIGKSGIERRFDEKLIGVDGWEYREVDVVGRSTGTVSFLPNQQPVPGTNLHLTIDSRLQKIVEDTFIATKGAVVAMDPDTFEIRAYLSRPAYDPNLFAGRLDPKVYRALASDQNKVFLNRPIYSEYPPGSIFKPVTLAAALNTKTIDQSFSCSCPGHYYLGRSFKCWKDGGHGALGPEGAIQNSCNVYFYKVGHMMGIDPIAKVGRAFGLGTKTGVELLGEKDGLMPDSAWKRQKYKEPWYPGETLPVAIGQGFLLMTPMQAVQTMGVIANRGTLYQPTLVSGFTRDGKWLPGPSIEERYRDHVELDDEDWDTIQNGMERVVSVGTARKVQVAGLRILGKTGTAQVVGHDSMELKKDEEPPPQFRDHNWFASICEAGDQRLCMVVFIENGGKQGGQWRLEFTRNIYAQYFQPFLAKAGS